MLSGSTGSMSDCQENGRSSGTMDSTDADKRPMLGQKSAICRSSSADVSSDRILLRLMHRHSVASVQC